jgi:hypothetical protein
MALGAAMLAGRAAEGCGAIPPSKIKAPNSNANFAMCFMGNSPVLARRLHLFKHNAGKMSREKWYKSTNCTNGQLVPEARWPLGRPQSARWAAKDSRTAARELSGAAQKPNFNFASH